MHQEHLGLVWFFWPTRLIMQLTVFDLENDMFLNSVLTKITHITWEILNVPPNSGKALTPRTFYLCCSALTIWFLF
jgi:hypothetical protein